MLEVLLVMVAVEDGEAEHAACDLLGLLLQLGQVLLGVICKSPGGSVEGQAGDRSLPHRSPTAYRERRPTSVVRAQGRPDSHSTLDQLGTDHLAWLGT